MKINKMEAEYQKTND
jgi:hypothetical protein